MEFALTVVLSFLIGGAYVSGVIWLSERIGSRAGAAIAGLPSTILVSIVFIVFSEGPEVARAAVAVVPLMFTSALIYALIFLRMVATFKNAARYPIAVIVATLAWLLTALIIRQTASIPFYYAVLFALFSLFGFRYALRKYVTVKSVKIKLTDNIYLLRFIVGGALIAASVIAAHVIDPTWGGIIASFPAMLGVILYFLNKSQGDKFLKGFLRSLPLSYIGSLTFIIIVHQTLTNIFSYASLILGMAGAGLYIWLLITARSIKAK
jgi:hypothetical protein